MIRITLDAILQARGKTVYWLSKQTGLTTRNLYSIKHGKAKELSLKTLSKICTALDCEPGDLLVRERELKK
jgi:putative transcriptional regulator